MKLECPKCRSNQLLIRQATGLEKIRVFLTGLRTFKCRDCYYDFRAPDRRKTPRRKQEETMFASRAGIS